MTETEVATFGMGCFWGPQLLFEEVDGVVKTEVGFMGGAEQTEVSYEEVCTGTTGHAEVVQITFDPSKISYEELLALFWKNHDPTTLDRQGPDVGDQYRSAIFYHDDAQKKLAVASGKKLQEELGEEKLVVTQIVKAGTFYRAEDYHQNYLAKRGQKVCH